VSPLNAPASDAPADLRAAATDASTDAFHIAMLIAALLCLAGAAVNAVGIVNPAKKPEEEPHTRAVTPCPQSPPAQAPAESHP
jgi:hypothetical protein